jgi:hypothetical protein
MGGRKVTKAVFAERIEKVVELLVLGLRPSEIVRYIAEKTDWDIKPRQVDNYIHHANAEITASSAINRDREVGKALRRFESLYKANMTIQDYKAALSVQKARNEMLGLNAPTKSQVAGTLTAMTWKEFMESNTSSTEDEDEVDNNDIKE